MSVRPSVRLAVLSILRNLQQMRAHFEAYKNGFRNLPLWEESVHSTKNYSHNTCLSSTKGKLRSCFFAYTLSAFPPKNARIQRPLAAAPNPLTATNPTGLRPITSPEILVISRKRLKGALFEGGISKLG